MPDDPSDESVSDDLLQGSDFSKSDSLEKVAFEAEVTAAPMIFKANDEFVIWGPASVEVVDKEGDKIHAKALSKALPQLLKRARLSLDHSDQLVGRILERFETGQSVTVEIDGQTYERSEFPTDVLELDGMEPALYVAGEIFDDTRQAKDARQRVENGELNSYSISGEALVTRKKIEHDGSVYNDVVDLDLSAVTLCEEGMNQKAKFGRIAESGEKTAAEKADAGDEPVSPRGAGRVPSVSAVASVAKTAASDIMSTNTEKGDDSAGGGFDLETLQAEFKSILDSKLPDGELATKDDLPETLTREDVQSIAQEVYATAKDEDVAGEEDDEDEARPDEEADEDAEEKQDAYAAVADDLGVSPDVLKDVIAEAKMGDDDDDEEVPPEEEEAPAPPDEEEAPPADEEAPPADEDVPPAPDEDVPAPEDEEVPVDEEVEVVDEEVEVVDGEEPPAPDEAPVPEEEAGDMGGFSEEDLEEMLPADVWEVVREYLGGGDAPGPEDEMMEASADDAEPMATAKSDSIEAAVERVLSGKGVAKTGGADTPAGDVEKSYSDEEPSESNHGNHPALANFY